LGQKVHPVGFRLGSYRRWHSYWFARKNYSDLLLEDQKIRKFIKNEKELQGAGIATVDIERAANKVKIKIHTSRPGIVIGQKGRKIEELRQKLEKLVGRELIVDIHEVRKPELNAQLVAENIALQLERRVAFRRAMKKAVGQAMKFGENGTAKAGFPSIPCGLILILVWPRQGLPTVSLESRRGFSRVKYCWKIA
jgi:small subunit ribosomal protein S3